jgi:hypothetical protein
VAADMFAARKGAARKGGTASRRNAEHHGYGDCENFGVNLSFHGLTPFSLVSNQSWAMKAGISNIDWCSV